MPNSDGAHTTLRITREVAEIQKGADLSLAAAFRDNDVRRVRALIIGPPGTPYEFGFFEFKVSFPSKYPTEPPVVTCITTNNGRTRFNPNIYAEGKVCLSIIGTWRGEPGEEWSTAQGLESILISIQSLMSANPYENEPGFENCSRNVIPKAAVDYAAKIHHETIRVSVLGRLERALDIIPPGRGRQKGNASSSPQAKSIKKSSPVSTPAATSSPPGIFAEVDPDAIEPFDDLCKRRFLWYYDSYVSSIHAAIAKHGDDVKDGAEFPITDFEHGGNSMTGSYCYTDLLARLAVVRTAIDDETTTWAHQAMVEVARESPLTHSFEQKFHHVVADLKRRHVPAEVTLVHGNPCLWEIVLFGRSSTNLDGGVFRIRMAFSLRFPDTELPRVTVETPIFHHRVAKDTGVLCYTAQRPLELASHVDGIIDAIEDERPAYDPRTLVNLEAAKLLWNGGAEGKKVYGRRLRRSAQDSIETA